MNRAANIPSAAASLDIDLMRGFVAVAETGSVRLAAARVGRTPAAVSMQLKRLEQTLGRQFFERSRRGMRLTAEGERLIPHARRLIEAERAALDAFRQPELAGSVTIGIIDDFAGVCLTDLLARFAKSHPKVSVEVVMGPTADLAPRLDRGALDLAVLTPGAAVEWRDGDRVLHEEPLVWVGRDGGSAWQQRPVPLAISSRGCAWRQQALAALDAAGTGWRIAYTSEFYAAQKAAVAADLAIAPLPRSLVEPGFRTLGKAEGLPGAGVARIALRIGAGAEPEGCIRALAQRIVETFSAGGA